MTHLNPDNVIFLPSKLKFVDPESILIHFKGVGRDGLIHISKLRNVNLAPNQSVKVKVEKIEGDRIGLLYAAT